MPVFSRSDLSDLAVFSIVVRRRSFSAAAIELGVTASAVSHTIRRLEARLGRKLLHRTSRTVSATQAGAELARRLEESFEPMAPGDLASHQCIRVLLGNSTHYRWELGDDERMVRVDVPGAFAVNDTDAAIDAALAGVGLCYVLERRIAGAVERGELEVMLPDWSSTGQAFYAYYPSRRQNHPALRELTNIIRKAEGLPSIGPAPGR